MPNYTPPPPTLDHLNPIQRYMQKGQLDRQDWIRLGLVLLAYFMLRPYIEKAAKWLMGSKEGEKATKEYQERRAKAKIGANTIRGKEKAEDVNILEELVGDDKAVVSGSSVDKKQAVNRKNKGPNTTILSQSEADKLLDWEGEPERKPADGEKTDVMQWLNKWDE